LKNNHAFSFGLCEQGEKDEYEELAEKICSSAVELPLGLSGS